MTERNWTQAPTSLTIQMLSPDGFPVSLTLRDEDGSALLPRALKALDWLKSKNFQPVTNGSHAAQPITSEPKSAPLLSDGTPDPAWCPVHGVAMARREKDGQVWYSHKAGDAWCRGKPNGR